MTFLLYFVLFTFLTLCMLLAFVILIQDSKSMGLGAAFGSDSGDSLFGTSTAQVLKKFTAYVAVVFVIGCLFLSLWTSSIARSHANAIPQAVEQIVEK